MWTLYGLATSIDPDRPNYLPSAWLERESWSVPTLADAADSPAALAFGLSSFPYFVALDAENRVVARASGETALPRVREDDVRPYPGGMRRRLLEA